jgi:hypothetical protein
MCIHIPNTLLKKVSNNIKQVTVMSEEEYEDYNEFLYKLFGEIHTKYGFTRSKL